MMLYKNTKAIVWSPDGNTNLFDIIAGILKRDTLVLFPFISKVKLATLVKGDPEAPFSKASTPRCRGGCYSFPWIAPLYSWSLPYNAEC